MERPLSRVKDKKVIGLMKDELSGKKMTEFIASKLKTYSYLTDVNDKNKKGKGTSKSIIKQKLECEDYKNCLEANEFEKERNHKEKNLL